MEELVTPPVYPDAAVRDDPDFPRAAAWLAASIAQEPEALVLGVPMSSLSLSEARCDLLPSALRAAMWTFSTYSPSLEADLTDLAVRDLGDVKLEGLDGAAALGRIREVCESLRGGPPVAVIGGDNSITAPAMLGLAGAGGGLITLDAHHDLRDYRRDGLSNGSPVRVLLDEGVEGERIWQIGIKDFSNSRAYSDLADKEGIHVVRMPEVRDEGVEPLIETALADLAATGAVYVDVDIDVVDRGLAPGAPASQPGGLHPAQVAYAAYLCGAHPSVRALDIVEVDPERDVAGATVRLAALVLLSFLAGVQRRAEARAS